MFFSIFVVPFFHFFICDSVDAQRSHPTMHDIYFGKRKDNVEALAFVHTNILESFSSFVYLIMHNNVLEMGLVFPRSKMVLQVVIVCYQHSDADRILSLQSNHFGDLKKKNSYEFYRCGTKKNW